MDDTTLIAKQQREIEDLKERGSKAVELLQEAHMRMVCIGGPLNDDRFHCTPAQRAEFWFVNNTVEGALGYLKQSGDED